MVFWPQQHILDAVLWKDFFRAAALELGFVATMDAGERRVPSPEFSSTHLKTGPKYSLSPLLIELVSGRKMFPLCDF